MPMLYRHCEERSDEATQNGNLASAGLLRGYARNDEGGVCRNMKLICYIHQAGAP